MTVDERRSRIDEIGERFKEIHAEFGADKLPDDIRSEWDGLLEERTDHEDAIADYKSRVAVLEEASRDNRRIEDERRQVRDVQPDRRTEAQPARQRVRRRGIPQLRPLPRRTARLYRDGALEVLEDAVFPHQDADDEKARTHVERLLKVADAGKGDLAERMLVTGSPLYQRAFGKKTPRPGTHLRGAACPLAHHDGGWVTRCRSRSTRRSSRRRTGSVNPLRQIARVETITNDEWRGVSSPA